MPPQTHPGALDYLRRQHSRRACDQSAGRLLYLPRTGLTVVPYERRAGGWRCVTVDGPLVGTRLAVADVEIETALDVAMVDPLVHADLDVFATVWQARVWHRWPGGPVPQLARVLAENLPPTRTVELHPDAVRRLLRQTHLRSPGLRQLLGKLTDAGLLTATEHADGEQWGTVTLTLPAADDRA